MRRALFLVIPLVAGCEQRDWCTEAAAYEPTLAIGTGIDAYSPLTEGDVVELGWGPQGGQHIWSGVKVTGIVPGVESRRGPVAPTIVYTLWGDQQTELGDGWREWPLEGDVDEAVSYGDTLILGWWEETYEAFEIRVQLRDSCGTELSEQIGVQLPEDYGT